MGLICSSCGRDLDEIWQDNMSPILGIVLCEDCARPFFIQEREDEIWQDWEERNIRKQEEREKFI